LNVCHPQYCVLEVGMNDSVSEPIEVFKEGYLELIDILEREGIIPVLTTIPRRMDKDNLDFITAANPWIKSLGYLVIDEAMAMSNGDGVTQDIEKYQKDLIHPSVKGGESTFDWIQANVPELLY